MRFQKLSVAALASLVFTAGVASAQPGARAGAGQEQRQDMRDKLKNMTPEERKAALEKAKENRAEHASKMTDEQKAWRKLYAAELKSTRAGVKAGTLTKETAASQLKTWRASNPRPKGTGGGV